MMRSVTFGALSALVVGAMLAATSGCGDGKQTANTDVNTDKNPKPKPSPAPGDTSSTNKDSAALTDASKSATPPNSASNEPWGDLKLRFTYGGDAPKRARIVPKQDQAFCGKVELFDESLIVNVDNRGVENVVMWLYMRGTKPPTPHASYKDSANDPVVLNNFQCRFEPHVCILQVKQPFHIKNSDTVGHNTKYDLSANDVGFNLQIAAGYVEKREEGFKKAESLPQLANCNAHGWMSAQLMIVDTPYFAKSDKDGNVVIKNLPVGEWSFRIHQEKMGYGRNLKIGTVKSSIRGVVKIRIRGGKNDLGDVSLSPSLFED